MSEDIIRLVDLAVGGDVSAMAKLFTTTLQSSFYLARRLSGDDADASEIVKQAYSRVFCTLSKLKKPEAFEIYTRQHIAAVYKEGVTFTFADATTDVTESAMEFLSQDMFEDELKTQACIEAVDSLSNELRAAIVLHYYSGMPVEPLAKYFNVSESTANAVLAKAKREVFKMSGSGEPEEIQTEAYPVLNRIFKRETEKVDLRPEVVRDIFTFVLERYNIYKEEELVKNPELAQRKSEYFSGSEPSIPPRPEVPTPEEDEDEVDFDHFLDEPASPSASAKKFDIKTIKSFFGVIAEKIESKGLDPKKIAILVGAVLLVILLIVGIAKIAGKDDNNSPSGIGYSVPDKNTKWVFKPGGFEDCTEITYLNEHMCCFKSATTGKYGLLDFQGNILIQPRYENKFKVCGSGRDYTGSGKYHVVIKIDEIDYYVTYSAGKAEITGTKHESHAFTNDPLPDDVKYEDRDRYFEGYAAALKNGKWGYVDVDGKKVVPYQYEPVNIVPTSGLADVNAYNSDYCRPVTGGLIAVKKNGNMGIINVDNDVIVPFEFGMIMPGLNGVFIAKQEGTWGVILVGEAINTFTGVRYLLDATDDEITTELGGIDKYYTIKGDGGVNVRRDADANSDKIGELPTGSKVRGCGTKLAANGREWLRIEYNGMYGYISMNLVSEIK